MKKEQLQNLIDEALNNEQFSGLSEPERADAVFYGVMGKVRVVRMKIIWKRLSIAASILVLLGAGWWVLMNQKQQGGKHDRETVVVNIPAPDKNRATITLADGSRVYLDSVNIGQHFTQVNTKIIKTADGKLVYTGDGSASTTIAYNTLTNPRGSRIIDLALADGSHVWLNAGSSIRYPVVFAGKERIVTVSGEAYFEVAKVFSRTGEPVPTRREGREGTMPFVVDINGKAAVEVLGTHFNVNAYDDETDVKVTLLEGSVRLTRNTERITLKPGQQGRASAYLPLTIDHSPDVDQVIAWKKGLFNFEDMNLDEALRQVSRWYDVKLIYEDSIPKTQLWGKMSRNTSFDRVLRNLKDIGVNYKLTEKKELIIFP